MNLSLFGLTSSDTSYSQKAFFVHYDIANVIGHAQCHASHKISSNLYNLGVHEAELTQPHTESLFGSTYGFFCINLRKANEGKRFC